MGRLAVTDAEGMAYPQTRNGFYFVTTSRFQRLSTGEEARLAAQQSTQRITPDTSANHAYKSFGAAQSGV